MEELDKKPKNGIPLIPEEGQRGFLSSNNEPFRCPPSSIKSPNISEDVELDYLASILVEAFLDRKEYERNKSHKPEASSGIR